jgi:hypothetical protein
MAYTKKTWLDRVVEKPMTFTMQNNGDGTTTLIPAEGAIIAAGTPINAANMNNLEKQYDEALIYLGSYVGDKSTLLTANKNSLVAALNELFQSASDVKTKVATAITGKGVTASSSDTGQQLADKIGLINTGKKWASGTTTSNGSQTAHTYADGSSVNKYSLIVSGLTFTPSMILIQAVSGQDITILFPIELNVSNMGTNSRILQGSSAFLNSGGSASSLRLDGTAAQVSATGFKMPVTFGSASYKWTAIE